jgi:hypothetical protein
MSQDPGKITLIKTPTGWCAKFDGEAAEYVRAAFGTDTIPTSYTSDARAKEVREAIHYLWPKCIVEVQ